MKTRVVLLLLVVTLCAHAECEDISEMRAAAAAQNVFSNLMRKAEKKYADAAQEQEKMIWVWSNFWLAVEDTARTTECAADEVIRLFSVFELDEKVALYRRELRKVTDSAFKPEGELAKRADALRARLEGARKTGRPVGRLRGRQSLLKGGEKGGRLAEELNKIEAEISRQKQQFQKLKSRQIADLQKKIKVSQKQLRSLQGLQGKGLKAPKVPKIGR